MIPPLAQDDVPVPRARVYVGTTPTYTALLIAGPWRHSVYIPGSRLSSMTLSTVDTQTGLVLRSEVDVLHTVPPAVDETGNISIQLTPTDTSLPEVPTPDEVLRSLILDFTYNGGSSVGRHEFVFLVRNLPPE